MMFRSICNPLEDEANTLEAEADVNKAKEEERLEFGEHWDLQSGQAYHGKGVVSGQTPRRHEHAQNLKGLETICGFQTFPLNPLSPCIGNKSVATINSIPINFGTFQKSN